MRAVVVALLVALAGCSQPADDVVIEDPELLISGVVVDDAVRAVVGATIEILSDGRNTTTDEFGYFYIASDPGTYTLLISKPGFQNITLDAVAGDPANVLLPLEVGAAPYVQESTFAGFIECGTNMVGVCAVPDFATSFACSSGGPCLGNPMNDNIWALLSIDPDATWVQAELAWESTQPLGDTLTMFLSHASQEQFDSGVHNGDLNQGTGTSPLVVTVPSAQAAAAGLGEGYGVVPRVFSGAAKGATQCVGATCMGAGAAVQQEFEVFLHSFYNMEPPEGWRFSEDGIPA